MKERIAYEAPNTPLSGIMMAEDIARLKHILMSNPMKSKEKY
jgi:hypothetical protein